jgi:pimeloyl-ACP methyl ester carboxylesterase
MSNLRRRGLGAVGLVGIGIATGIAAEKAFVRSRYGIDPEEIEPFGQLHGEEIQVMTDDGVFLHVEVHEPTTEAAADGLTIVFAHGYALNQQCWHYQRRDLRSVARLVFADQRAHGRSLRGDPAKTTIDQLGADLGTVIDTVGMHGPTILVGHSMGGMTVMALAAHRPELFAGDGPIKGVALLGTSAGGIGDIPLGMPASVSRYVHLLAPAALHRALPSSQLIDAGRSRTSDLAALLVKHYSFGSRVAPSLVNFSAQMINGTPFEVVAEFLEPLAAHDKYDALATMTGVDAVVMVGSKDLVTPVGHSREIVRRMPQAEMVILPNTGHMLMLERYEEVNYYLHELIDRVRANWRAASPQPQSEPEPTDA